MNSTTTFDVLAEAYDTHFVESFTGRVQRYMSRKWLLQALGTPTPRHILEINCGTGEDALWMAAQGHRITATDASPAMIAQAKQKTGTRANEPVFHTCAFNALSKTFPEQQFDCIFSNFAGLNCVPPGEMTRLAKQFHTLLKPGGVLAAVLFGKYCLWELLYYLYKAKPQQAFRRFTQKAVHVPLTPYVHQPVHYYSISQFAQLMAPLQLVAKRPVGLFIPPSYLEEWVQQRPRLWSKLVHNEERIKSASAWSALADHSFILLKKEAI